MKIEYEKNGSVKEEKQWKVIEPNVWKPEQEEDQIEGVLIEAEPATPDFSARYHIEAVDGQYLVWGSAVLDDRMKYVKIGSMVRITYKGKKEGKKKGQFIKIYKVELKQ